MNLGTFHAYVTQKGRLLPSTLRLKEGDARDALEKCGYKYRGAAESCRPVRVTVVLEEAPTARLRRAQVPPELERSPAVSSRPPVTQG
jgi:hypothetical protein